MTLKAPVKKKKASVLKLLLLQHLICNFLFRLMVYYEALANLAVAHNTHRSEEAWEYVQDYQALIYNQHYDLKVE